METYLIPDVSKKNDTKKAKRTKDVDLQHNLRRRIMQESCWKPIRLLYYQHLNVLPTPRVRINMLSSVARGSTIVGQTHCFV